MAAIDFRNKTIKYYDSMGSPNKKCLEVDKFFIFTDCHHDLYLCNSCIQKVVSNSESFCLKFLVLF